MEVYFVRHGQTIANANHKYQPPDTRLTKLGERQAHAVAVRLRELNPTRIIASPFTRAYQTAKIIGEELSLPVITHESLVELRRPKYMYGKGHYSLKSMWFIAQWFFTFHDPKWRELGAESYEMFIDRIHEAREYLESFRDDERIIVVSHSIFINFFVQHVCNEERMRIPAAVLRVLKIKVLDNSSITHTEYYHSETLGLCTWILKEFDDDEHVVT